MSIFYHLPNDLKRNVFDQADPLTQYLNDYGSYQHHLVNQPNNQHLAIEIWRAAFEQDWDGDIAVLPRTCLPHIHNGLDLVKSRRMYDRLCSLFPKDIWTYKTIPKDPHTKKLEEIYRTIMQGYHDNHLGLIHVAMRHGWWDVVVRGAVENEVHVHWKYCTKYAYGGFDLEGSWEELIRYANDGLHKEFQNYIARNIKKGKGLEAVLRELDEGGNCEVEEEEEEIEWTAYMRDPFMHRAVQFGYLDIARGMNKSEYFGAWDLGTPFERDSVLSGNLAMVQLIVGDFKKGQFGSQAYECAAAIGSLDIFKYLTELGVQPVTRKVTKLAAKYQSTEVAQYILDKWPKTYGKWITQDLKQQQQTQRPRRSAT
jgi:hypothetical protein